MWEPRPLTPLWAFTACYRDSFTLLFTLLNNSGQLKEEAIPQVLPVVFFIPWGGVRLSPLGTSATNCPIVPAPDDR
jgi:hypothetical protein